MKYFLTFAFLLVFAASVAAGEVTFVWDQENVENVSVWHLYMAETEDGEFARIAEIPYTGQTEYTGTIDAAVIGTGQRVFYITASNAVGESAPSNTVVHLFERPMTPINFRLVIE